MEPSLFDLTTNCVYIILWMILGAKLYDAVEVLKDIRAELRQLKGGRG